jgi:hypothetical protein
VEVLADRVARDGPLDELDAVGWAVRLAKTLDALHREGKVHGAVSPSAIRIESADRGSRGVLLSPAATPADTAYCSRERALGREPASDDDVWAAAATLYLALTGTPPWSGDSPAELAEKIAAGPPAPLAVFDAGDDDLQRVLDAAFHRDLMERTSTAAALHRDLARWRADAGFAQLPALEVDRIEREHTAATRVEPAAARAIMQEESSDSDGGQTMVKPALLEDEEDEATLLRQGPDLLSAVAESALAAPPSVPRPGLSKPLPAAGRPAEAQTAQPVRREASSTDRMAALSPRPVAAGGPTPFARAAPPSDPLAGTIRMEPGEAAVSPLSPLTPFDASSLPDAGQEDEDDEDDLRTVMRMSPFAMRASEVHAPGGAGHARQTPQPQAQPQAQAQAQARPRPPEHLAPGLPVLHDDDDSDDEMQTVLRDVPAELHALAGGARVGGPVMTPHPAAPHGGSHPPAGFGPLAQGRGAPQGFGAPDSGFGGPQPGQAGQAGQAGQGGFPVPSGAFPPPVSAPGFGGPMPGAQMQPSQPNAFYPQPMMQGGPPMAPYRPPPALMPSSPPGAGRTSVGLAIVVALLALILAAGATFLFLRSRGPGFGRVGTHVFETAPTTSRG